MVNTAVNVAHDPIYLVQIDVDGDQQEYVGAL
jgi:hypothetical protein